MIFFSYSRNIIFILTLLLSLSISINASGEIEESVIKIYCASQSYIFNRPWKKSNIKTGIGSGFLIKGNRILTNAHVVSNARYIEVQTFLSSSKFIAEVEFISHNSDLAILKVKDKQFFKGLVPLELGPLPELNSEVTTYGYPMGGVQLSVTRGVVSRIEMHTYSHSGMDQHLTIQTDAAINPGNSGGPVIQKGKVIGVAFQGMRQADNVGYMIPSIVVQQFLEDIKNGKVDGFSELAVEYAEFCENPTFRKLIGLPKDLSGVVVTRLYPNMPAYKKLKQLDVILSIDGNKITNDGFIFLEDRKVKFFEAVERHQVGSMIPLEIWRDKKKIKLQLKASTWKLPIPSRNPHGVIPKYFIFGGLAFTTLSKGYIAASGGWKSLSLSLRKLYLEAHTEEKYSKHKEFPVLTERLPDRINVNMEEYVGQVVESVNGKKVHSLMEFKNKLEKSEKDLIEIRFIGYDVPLIISKKDAFAQSDDILNKYHITRKERF